MQKDQRNPTSIGLSRSIFKAYDIRGIVGESFGAPQAYTIGCALAQECRPHGRVAAVGRDGRLSSAEIAKALISGLNHSGVATVDVGEVPTPLLYFTALEHAQGSGFMVTGSHNPPDYNGIKMMVHNHTLAGDDVQRLYQRCVENRFDANEPGSNKTIDVTDEYLDRLADDVRLARPLRIGADCGNGVAGPAVKQMLDRLGCETVCLYCDVDGRFPNHHPDPSVPENLAVLIETVKEKNLDVGLAFDGDGDRLGVVDDVGRIVWADRQMMLFAKDVLAQHPGCSVIYDVKSSHLLEKIIKDHGGTALMCRTGHSFVKSALQETGALLAGEMSGHVFFKDRWFGFDDALYAAARLLEIISREAIPCSSLFDKLPAAVSTPEINVHFEREDAQHEFMRRFVDSADFGAARISKVDGVRAELDYGWGLVRASNTTPCLVIRFEADSKTELKRLQSLFRNELLKVEPSLPVPF